MKFLGIFNLLGVFTMAILCVVQWEVNRRVNLDAINLDMTRQQQARQIADLDKTIAGDKADLEEFRQRLEQSALAIKEGESRIAKVTSERNQAIAQRDATAAQRDGAVAERDALKADLVKWIDALRQRDDAIKKEGDEYVKALKDRNDAVERFNDLAGRYNTAVTELNAARAKLAGH